MNTIMNLEILCENKIRETIVNKSSFTQLNLPKTIIDKTLY